MFFLTNDIVLDQYSPTDSTGSVRGGYLTVLNLGYVLAPIITGYILARMGFSSLYTLTAIILIPVIWLAFLAPAASHTHHSKVNIFASLKKLWKTNDLRNIVFANFILQFFYSWMVIYTPLYLHNELGIPWDNMGSIFSIMLFAFVLTQIPFGKLADKFLGEKELLITGFIIMGISTLTLYILPYFTLTLLAFILFITRIGASCIEVMTETYFFKKVSSSETGIISIFRNTYPTSYIIAPLIASGVVALAPTKYLFLILGIICLLGILFVIPIRDTK
jgi:MFS family permease